MVMAANGCFLAWTGLGSFRGLEAHLPHPNRNQTETPVWGVSGSSQEAFPASKNYDLKQRLGWVGLEQAAGGEPAPLIPVL